MTSVTSQEEDTVGAREDIEGITHEARSKEPKFYSSQTRTAHSYIESFLSFEDAVTFMEGHLRDYKDKGDFHVLNASVTFVNSVWRAGVTFEKKQMEMFDTND